MQNGQFEAEILMRVGHRLIALSRVINEDEGRTTLSNSEQFKVGGNAKSSPSHCLCSYFGYCPVLGTVIKSATDECNKRSDWRLPGNSPLVIDSIRASGLDRSPSDFEKGGKRDENRLGRLCARGRAFVRGPASEGDLGLWAR